MSLGQLRELTPRGIEIAMRQTLRWARAAAQDLDPFVKALHANYAVGNLDQLRQLASDAEILAATGLDPAVLAGRFARLQDEAAAAVGLEGRRGMTVPLSRRGEALGQGAAVTPPAPTFAVPRGFRGFPEGTVPPGVTPPVLEPERTVRPAPAAPAGILRRRTEAPARFTAEEAPPGILFRFFAGPRPGSQREAPAAAETERARAAPRTKPAGPLFRFFQALFPARARAGARRPPTSVPGPVRALGQGEFFGFPVEEVPAVTVPTAEVLREPSPVLLAARGDTGPTVRRVQELLRTLAFPVGRVDGVFGPLTEQAVRLFQQEGGLPVTGAVDDFTLAALEAAVVQAGPPAPVPGTTPGETQRRTFPRPGQAGPPILFGLRAEQLAGAAFVVAVLGIAAGGGPPRGRGGVPRPGTIEVVSNHDQQTYVRAAADGDLVLVRRLLAKYPEVPRREWAKLTPLPPGL